jgi:hypothetical protein
VAGLGLASVAALLGTPRDGDLLGLTPIFAVAAALLLAGVFGSRRLSR